MPEFVVCALYKFVSLENYQEIQVPLLKVLLENQVKGTLLLAEEGINGTIAGDAKGIDSVLNWLKKDDRLNDLVHKRSYDEHMPFYRTKVKLKQEIVTMGVKGVDPEKVVGTYVPPAQWNKLISDPKVTLIDTRNDYEVEIGTFKNAINPNTETFREFPQYVKEHLDPSKHKKVAMFCTGGIRCEKSTAYLKEQGFEEVYHLEGGILKYLEEIPKKNSLWQGDCFVFDNRVAVNHDLEKGDYDQCHACRYPITEQDKLNVNYVAGVSCPRCFDKHSPEQIEKFKEREKQMQLAKKRGEIHIGSEAAKQSTVNRGKKLFDKQHQKEQIQKKQHQANKS